VGELTNHRDTEKEKREFYHSLRMAMVVLGRVGEVRQLYSRGS
jgi:hypothetical protein